MTLRLFLIFSLAASTVWADSPAPPRFKSTCVSCSATGVIGYESFQAHLDAVDPKHPANAVFHRHRQSEALAIAGGVVGIALSGTALLVMPGDCEIATVRNLGRVNTGKCSFSTAQWAYVGAGATLLAGSAITFYFARPREPELIASMNAFNADHPDRPFTLAGTGLRPIDRRPLLLDPEILIPGTIAVAGAIASAIAFADAERAHLELEVDAFDSYGEGYALADRGATAQRNALIFAGVSAAAFGVTSYFISRPFKPIDVAVGPTSISIAGSFE